MDILSARKKAAEMARARKETKTPEPAAADQAPAAQPPVPRESPPAAAPSALPAQAPEQAAEPKPESEPAVSEDQLAEETAETQEIEMLSFRLGDEEYALLIEDVKEVLKNRELTPVPNAPDYLPGVTALRGPVLPVIDLCRRLGIPNGVRDEKSRILVVSLNDENVGVIVDRVTGVIKIHPDMIRPVPETIEHGAEFLRGIARRDDKLYILLDKEKALGA